MYGVVIIHTWKEEVGRLQYMLGIIYNVVCSLPTDVLGLFSLPIPIYIWAAACLLDNHIFLSFPFFFDRVMIKYNIHLFNIFYFLQELKCNVYDTLDIQIISPTMSRTKSWSPQISFEHESRLFGWRVHLADLADLADLACLPCLPCLPQLFTFPYLGMLSPR